MFHSDELAKNETWMTRMLRLRKSGELLDPFDITYETSEEIEVSHKKSR